MFDIVGEVLTCESSNTLLNQQMNQFLDILDTDEQYDQLGEILVSMFHLSQELIRERLLEWRRIPDDAGKPVVNRRAIKEEKAKAFLAKYINLGDLK